MIHQITIYGQESSPNYELTTALIGLFGVFVGSIISYYFNKKLHQENGKATIAIQRKNLIFSKLYKELINIKSSVNSLPEKCVYFDIKTGSEGYHQNYNDNSTFYFYKNRYPLADFKLWYEIKKDIRNTQIPDDIRVEMDKLQNYIESYLTSLSKSRSTIESILQKRKQESGISFLLDIELFYFEKTAREIVTENIEKNHNSNTSLNVKEEMEIVANLIINNTSVLDVFTDFKNMSKQVNLTLEVLEKLIKRIVDKYEFGQSI
jgi:hypothetical protein